MNINCGRLWGSSALFPQGYLAPPAAAEAAAFPMGRGSWAWDVWRGPCSVLGVWNLDVSSWDRQTRGGIHVEGHLMVTGYLSEYNLLHTLSENFAF